MEQESPEPPSPERDSKTKRPGRIVKKPHDSFEQSSTDNSTNTKWSQKEIKTLLLGLNKFGLTRMSSILDMLPNRTYEQAKPLLWKIGRDAYKIKSQEREVECDIKEEEADECAIGVTLISNERQKYPTFSFRQLSPITKSLLFLENLEQHPSPASDNAIDFKQLYNAVYMAMKGYPLPNMNDATLKFFCESFQNLLKAASGNIIESFPIEDCQAIERLSENDIINPLSLHFESLKARIDQGHLNHDEFLNRMRDWVSPNDWNSL